MAVDVRQARAGADELVRLLLSDVALRETAGSEPEVALDRLGLLEVAREGDRASEGPPWALVACSSFDTFPCTPAARSCNDCTSCTEYTA